MVLQNDGLWYQVLISKYLKKLSVMAWLRGKNFNFHGVSVIWKGLLLTLPWLGRILAWQVGNGKDVLIGINPIIGASKMHSLPEGFR